MGSGTPTRPGSVMRATDPGNAVYGHSDAVRDRRIAASPNKPANHTISTPRILDEWGLSGKQYSLRGQEAWSLGRGVFRKLYVAGAAGQEFPGVP